VTKRALVILGLVTAASPAFADAPGATTASPYGTSQYVVAYAPPAVADPAHRGFTLQFELGGGSTSVESSAGAVAFQLGGWLTHDLSLAFRFSTSGSFMFVGGSAQYYALRSLWFGGGIGGLTEKTPDYAYDEPSKISGTGGFARIGYNLVERGEHALYVAGEVQGGQIGGVTRAVAFVSLGYQLL
jgi:hypothetical protein